jgi:hypothetical protein
VLCGESQYRADGKFFNELMKQTFPDGKGWFCVIQGFCDESGTHADAPVFCVGGYLFSPEKATLFHDKWREVLRPLRPKGITHFHATHCGAKKREFKNLSDPERSALFRSLVDLIHETAEIGVIAEIKRDEYGEWVKANPRFARKAGSEFAIACMQCLVYFAKWVGDLGETEIVYKFESGDKPNMDEVSALLNAVSSNPPVKEALRFREYGFSPKGATAHQLEAADLLLWAHQKLHVDHKAYPDYVKISRRLFYKSPVIHRVLSLTPLTMTLQALYNESRGLPLE